MFDDGGDEVVDQVGFDPFGVHGQQVGGVAVLGGVGSHG
jgi:hypothetical protein